MKQTGLSQKFVAENVKCNDINIINFVELHGDKVEEINNFLTKGKYSKSKNTTVIAQR